MLAQLRINEAISDNESGLVDAFGKTSDWIELYNSSSETVNLANYCIGDKIDEKCLWPLPPVQLAPGGFQVIFASGRDTIFQEAHANFKLSRRGELLYLRHTNGTIIDSLGIPSLPEDFSYGRFRDGEAATFFFVDPSPGISNNMRSPIPQAARPSFGEEQVFFEEAFDLTLACSGSNCSIRYTLDGSEPDEESLLYEGPILVEETQTIRCRSYRPGMIPSEPQSRTYYIDVETDLPILSFHTDPDYLFDWEEGIFIKGPDADSLYPHWGANYWKDIDIPVQVEWLENRTAKPLSFELEARIHGGTTARNQAMKSLRFNSNIAYGDLTINHTFFPEKNLDHYRRLVIRNASGDFNVAHLRDAFLSRYFLRENLNIDLLAHRPLEWYVNGEYWGLINLREKVDEFYLSNDYGADPTNLDLLEEEDFPIAGSFELFDSLQSYIDRNDLSDPAVFEYVSSQIDLASMADYFIVETYVNNTDWPVNNIKFWRERKEGSKWRYILFDLDATMGRFPWTVARQDGLAIAMAKEESRHVLLLKELWTNETYRHYFINRYADLINSTFTPERFSAEIQSSADEIRKPIQRHLQRWYGDFDRWENEAIPQLLEFATDRPDYARQHLQDFFQLDRQVELQLQTYPAGAGTIKINTIQAEELPWRGVYYAGVPVEISIEPAPGYRFSHWESLAAFDRETSLNLRYDFSTDDQLVAYFDYEYPGLNFSIQPNPVSNTAMIYFELPQKMTVDFSLLHPDGRIIRQWTEEESSGGQRVLNHGVEDLAQGVYYFQIRSELGVETKAFVKY